VGVQRTIPASKAALWRLLLGPEGLAQWLGKLEDLPLKPGRHYQTADGTRGEIRSVDRGTRLRLTYQPAGEDNSSTLQITLSCPRNTAEKTTLRFHQEKLRDAEHREQMRAHWKQVAAGLSAMARGRRSA
jgi:uncharacterized protein YndB with AHSA1/START domain